MKIVKTFKTNEEIPNNALFLASDVDRMGSRVFYYEIKEDAKETSKTSAVNFKPMIDECITYLNNKTGSNFKPGSQSNKALLKRILTEYTVDDVKKAIDNKVKEWIDTEFAIYLRPSTLFNPNKFENYLNSKVCMDDVFDELSGIMLKPSNADSFKMER